MKWSQCAPDDAWGRETRKAPRDPGNASPSVSLWEDKVKKISGLFATVAAAAVTLALTGAAYAAGPIVGLVTKTNTNPFFVKMKEGFEAKAKELGLTPQAYAGKADGDNDGQVAAIEQLMAAGAKGILLVPSDSTAIVPTVKKARDAGVIVITLNYLQVLPGATSSWYLVLGLVSLFGAFYLATRYR